jgi:hypothetical protein
LNTNSKQKNNTRQVFCEDAIAWLKNNPTLPNSSLVASLPDISEFPSYTLEMWKEWFINAASLIISRTPEDGVAIFYQSDIKLDGKWIDKGYLCQKAAELESSHLLWHKIACRTRAGQATFSRCSYSHVLCFSRKHTLDIKNSTADVIPEIGDKTWTRGMGLEAAMMIANFIATETQSTYLINPFCGQGSMLAAANAAGLSAIGIERSAKRAAQAQTLKIDLDNKKWCLNADGK